MPPGYILFSLSFLLLYQTPSNDSNGPVTTYSVLTKGYHEGTFFYVLIPNGYMNGQLLIVFYERIHERTTFDGTEGIN
jgi:hypothetical protein